MTGNFFKMRSGTLRKFAVTLTRALTPEQAYDLGMETGRIHVLIKNDDKNKDYCFVDSHGIPPHLHESDWLIATQSFPCSVVAREGLEDGVVDTIEKYCAVFHRDGTYLQLEAQNRLSAKEFFEWYAQCEIDSFDSESELDLGKAFTKEHDLFLPYLHNMCDNKKAFWYIVTNFVILE